MSKCRRLFAWVAPAIALAMAVGIPYSASWAQKSYPERPITIVVPYPPGGAMDTTARLVGQKLADELGQSVIVDNRAGAGGSIGAQSVAREKPDGYTLLISNQGPNVVREILYPDTTTYRTARDFAAVSTLTTAPLVLAVRADSPFKSVSDLVSLGREESKRFNFASAGIGSQSHIAGEALNVATDREFLHVPYGGAAQMLTALLSGEAQFGYLAAADALSRMSDGSLRALGVASASRFALAPDVPTLTEQGIPNQNFDVWYGFLVPAGTEPERIEILRKAVVRVMAQEEVVERFKQMGVEAKSSTSEEMSARLLSDKKLYEDVIRKAGIKPN